MNQFATYQITLRGRVDEADLNATSPLQVTMAAATEEATQFCVDTDQSGLVGLVRHLHARGLVLLSVENAPSPPAGAAGAASPARPTSRRRFLKMGCLTVGTAGLAAAGVGLVIPDAPPIAFESYRYGEKTMKQRILVAYASETGSTMGVAAAIGEQLAAQSSSVDVRPITGESDDASPTPLQLGDAGSPQYAAVVIGSAVQYGQWLPAAIQFVADNREVLGRVPVALFCVHIQNRGDDATSRRNRLAYLDAVRSQLQAVDEGYFDGRFDRRGAKKMLPRWVAWMVPTLDLRNWTKIRAWAGHIRPLLLQT
jgi:menaquinone-dependent protoporphyrinogen oxidase